MVGRIAAFALGSAIGRRRAQAGMAHQAQQAQPLQPQQAPNQEDVTQKLQKLADLHQKGVLTDEEFQKLKMDLIAKL